MSTNTNIQDQIEEGTLPQFKYQPNCYTNGVFTHISHEEERFECPCCENETEFYYPLAMYAEEEIGEMCPRCIADGSVARDYDGQFIQDAEEVSDSEKTKELFERTPGYESWQGEYWLACCDDYCAFIDRVGIAELKERGIVDEVLSDYANAGDYSIQSIQENLNTEGPLTGYLFQCLNCGKYRLGVDAD